jgi:hypothetical protein
MKIKVRCKNCGKIREINRSHGESSKNYIKRRPLCIKCGHKKRIETLGGHAPNWKGGKSVDKKGYIRIWDRNKKCYIKEHKKVWEENYGEIPEGYVFHHKDGNKQNNSLDNLEILPKVEHDKLNDSLLKNHWNKKLKQTEDLTCVEYS